MEKVDIHLHLTLQQLPERKEMYLSSAKQMIPHLKSLGIFHGILMASGEDKVPFGSVEENRKICEEFPDIYHWMCNFEEELSQPLYERMKKYKNQGAVGVGELMINKKLSHPFLQDLFRQAEKLEMPVLLHMSPQEGMGYGVVDEPGLPLLEQVLKTYPNLKVIGHSQPFWHEISKDASNKPKERNEWGSGPIVPGGRLVTLFETYHNLWGDLSANSGGCAIMRDEPFGLWFLERFQDRLMFGTDMVNIRMEFPLGNWLDQMREKQKLSAEAYEKICRKNAEQIFGLSI